MSLDNENIKGADEMMRKLKAAQLYLQTDVPTVVGTLAVNHFKASFANEGFTDNGLTKWASRKMKVKHGRGVLRGGTAEGLEDSIDYRVEGTTIIIYSDKLYAQIHNEGGEIIVTPKMKSFFWAKSIEAKEAGDLDSAEQYKWCALAKKITIQQRMFIGNSQMMNNKIVEKIIKDLNNILNP